MIDYLIFDGNYLLHKCVHSLKNTGKLYEGLYRLLEITVNKYVNMNSWEHIIFVSDSRKPSWRTQIKNNYKGTRKPDESIDWKFVYETYNDFKLQMEQDHILLEADHIEGDDWIFFLNKYANNNGKGTCIVSSDGDLHQLLTYSTKKDYINIQIADNMNKVYIPIGWELVYTKVTESSTGTDSLFSMNNDSENIKFFDHITNTMTVSEVYNKSHLFKKILTGDKGDNVMSIHKTMTSTGKLRGIGDKTAEKVWDHYMYSNNSFDTSNDTHLNEMINSYEMVKGNDFTINMKKMLMENIKENIQMMELNINSYPEDIKLLIIDKILMNIDEEEND